MRYVIKMSDRTMDTEIVMEVVASNVFDAVSAAANSIENPEDTELIEACPVFEDEEDK